MLAQRSRVIRVNFEDEMKESYLAYAMSTIIDRALPDVRDGLKPSQRRILVAMNDLNLTPGRQYRKCAKVAGDTSGNYHPHGEQGIYPTLVRMAQDFRMRYRLVDGQGNFGSIDYPDRPAAMRYTEARMTAFAVEMLQDIEKETVDFVPNYDDTRQEPKVLPGAFPNLICNGTWGIAVAMTSAIPPHNLKEVVDGIVALIDNPDISDDELMEYVKAPDFPTGGIIYGMDGVRDVHRTGTGRIVVRARASIEILKNGRENVVITEIPFLVDKSHLLESIGDLVSDKRIDGVAYVRDESDRDGMRIVIELKRDTYPNVVMNQLYKHTELQTSFNAIQRALVNNRPVVLNLKGMLSHFVDHRHEVIRKRTRYDLTQAENRAHLLEGFKIALDSIDQVIRIIRGSDSPDDARVKLMDAFQTESSSNLSETQARAILNLTLQRLTALERKKVDDEYLEVIKNISELQGILDSRPQRMDIIKSELTELKKKYGDERRTEIVPSGAEFDIEDLIAEEDMVITISHAGYIKRLPVSTYKRQRRGGRGITGMTTKEEDFVEHLFIASTHSYMLFFTDRGKCYWLKVYEIPESGRAARGRPIVNLLQVETGERIEAFVHVKEFDDDHYLVMATRRGLVKKTVLSAYGRPIRTGIRAINIVDGDSLIDAAITDGTQGIVLVTQGGFAIRFDESEVRDMGRTSQGVRGISLRDGADKVVGMMIVRREGTILTVCENGYGKRSQISDYRITHRGGKGIISIKANQRNGKVISVKEVVDEDELIIISQNGIIMRQPVRAISVIGRNTQGVRLIKLDKEDKVIDVARVALKDEVEVDSEGNGELDEEDGDGKVDDIDDLQMGLGLD